MKIIVVATRNANATQEAVAPLAQAEAKKALELWASGLVREINGRADGQGAILVIEAASEDEARAALAELPLAQAGLLDLDFIPVVPYRGLGLAAGAL